MMDILHRYQKTKVPHIIGRKRSLGKEKKMEKSFLSGLAVSEVILNDRIIYTGIIHDLTNVKNAEKEISLLNKKLEKKVTERTLELERTVNKFFLRILHSKKK